MIVITPLRLDKLGTSPQGEAFYRLRFCYVAYFTNNSDGMWSRERPNYRLRYMLRKAPPWGELAPVRATERGLQFLRLIVITPLRLDKLGTSPQGEAFLLLAVLYKKRLEVRVLADLRSFLLRKNILLQIKIRRSTAVGGTVNSFAQISSDILAEV